MHPHLLPLLWCTSDLVCREEPWLYRSINWRSYCMCILFYTYVIICLHVYRLHWPDTQLSCQIGTSKLRRFAGSSSSCLVQLSAFSPTWIRCPWLPTPGVSACAGVPAAKSWVGSCDMRIPIDLHFSKGFRAPTSRFFWGNHWLFYEVEYHYSQLSRKPIRWDNSRVLRVKSSGSDL